MSQDPTPTAKLGSPFLHGARLDDSGKKEQASDELWQALKVS